ncbi:hypothetical protein Q5752_001798 [Cryptotrichosporon argae]
MSRPALTRLAAPSRLASAPTLRPAAVLSAFAPSASSSLSTSASSSASAAPSPSPAAPLPGATAAKTRVFPARKAFLFDYYTHLLSSSQLILLFAHDNLSVSDLARLRRAINAVPVPASASVSDAGAAPAKARLEVVRTGLLAPVTRSQAASLEPHLAGPTALLTCPSLSPPYLAALLGALARALKMLKHAEQGAKQPVLQLKAGVLEGNRLMAAPQVEAVSKLPDLDVLRAQVVGLLEGGGRSLLGVLEQGRGGGLVRTLQGLEKSLQGGEGNAEGKAE